jgi:type I restriction enzyme M protein
VPESLLSSQRYRHVVDYIRARVDIRAVVGMPESLFKTSGSGGTHTKTCLVVAQKVVGKRRPISIFMAETRWCGNDSRGRREGPDELPEVARRYTIPKADRPADHLSYEVTADELVDNIMAPRYYDPEPKQMLQRLQQLTSS